MHGVTQRIVLNIALSCTAELRKLLCLVHIAAVKVGVHWIQENTINKLMWRLKRQILNFALLQKF